MRTVIGRKGERPAGNDGGKAVGFFLQPREPLRARLAGKREQGGRARKMAPGDFAVSAHWQRSGSGLAGCIRASRSTGKRCRAQRRQHGHAKQFDQLQREDLERQPPAERLHIDDRDQAPRHQ